MSGKSRLRCAIYTRKSTEEGLELIDMVARAHAYLEALTGGKGSGRKDVAKRLGVHPEDVSRMLPLAFLSPRIVESILTDRQPADLSVRHLARNIELPIVWADQSRLLGI